MTHSPTLSYSSTHKIPTRPQSLSIMSYYRDHYILQVLHSVLRPPKAQNNSQSLDNVKPEWQLDWPKTSLVQRAKNVVSDSPGLMDFAIGLVNSVFNLPDRLVMFLEEFE